MLADAAATRRPEVGEAIYASLVVGGRTAPSRVRGIVVEVADSSATLAVASEAVDDTEGTELGEGKACLSFLTLRLAELTRIRPASWGGVQALTPWPSVGETVDAYNTYAGVVARGLSSDEMQTASDGGAQAAAPRPPSTPSFLMVPPSDASALSVVASPAVTAPPVLSSPVVQHMLGLIPSLFATTGATASSAAAAAADSEGDADSGSSSGSADAFPPPGAGGASSAAAAPAQKPSKASKTAKPQVPKITHVLADLISQASAAGQPVDMRDMMMYAMFERLVAAPPLATNTKTSSSKLLSSDSGSDSHNEVLAKSAVRGLRGLRHIRRRIRRHPRRVVSEWERGVREALGVQRTSPWTMQDWRKSIPWGKQAGLQRCCTLLVAAYELLRQEQPDAAAAQLVQAMKAVSTTALHDGDWRLGWAYSGLRDPCGRLVQVGTEEEALAGASYVDASVKLRESLAKARHTTVPTPVEQGDDGEGDSFAHPNSWKAKKAAKRQPPKV